MGASAKRNCAQRGFTLVELLVVIVIIAILAGATTAAIVAALKRAKEARVKTEIASLENALQQYKEKYGEFPPDFAGLDSSNLAIRAAAIGAVTRHLRRVFPNYANVTGWPTDLAANGVSFAMLSPASSLSFWLGGLPSSTGGSKLRGFSANPANPFDNSASRLDPFFNFDERRLVLILDAAGAAVVYYYPDTGESGNRLDPYVYFKARAGGYDTNIQQFLAPTGEPVVPYLDSLSGDWVDRKTHQIISAGLDGEYGVSNPASPPLYPAGTNYTPGHYDNITSFSDTTLEDGLQ